MQAQGLELDTSKAISFKIYEILYIFNVKFIF